MASLHFLDYSICHLLDHANAAALEGVCQKQFLNQFPLQDYIKAKQDFSYDDEVLKADSGLLYVLVVGNHGALIQTWLRIDPAIDPMGGHLRTPFLAALAYKKTAALQALLSPDLDHPLSDLLSPPTSGEVSAILSTYEGHSPKEAGVTLLSILWFFLVRATESVSLALLRSGKFPFDATQLISGTLQTPLSYATRAGHDKLVHFLLKIPHQHIEVQDSFRRTPLSLAAASGYVNIVQSLLGSGDADVNSRSQIGKTPLIYEAEEGRENVVTTLLQAPGIHVNAADALGRTPLSYAAERGHWGVVEMLL